jgi:Ino eighty subunit 2
LDTINKLLLKPASKKKTRAEIIAAQLKAARSAGSEYKSGTPGVDGSNAVAGQDGLADGASAIYEEPPNPLFTRWISNSAGSRVAVPEEWLAGPAGEVFSLSTDSTKTKSGVATEKKDVEMKLVEEVA